MTEPQSSRSEDEQSTGRSGRGWAIAGIVFGVIALLVIPIVFGPLGVILGIVGYRKGEQGLGIAAIIIGVLGLVLGIIINLLLFIL